MAVSTLLTFAKERSLQFTARTVYGKLHGLYVAMAYVGKGVSLQVYLRSPKAVRSESEDRELSDIMYDIDWKAYCIAPNEPYSVNASHMTVNFKPRANVNKHIAPFIDAVLPRIAAVQCAGRDCCWHCGEKLTEEPSLILLDGMLLPLDENCLREMQTAETNAKYEHKEGSLATGTLGALLGAIVGAIPWALMFMFGYITGIVGLLIAFLSDFGYRKLHGKESRLRVVIVVAMVIIGVCVGTVGGYALQFVKTYYDEDMENYGYTLDSYITYSAETFILYDQKTALGREYDREVAKYEGDPGDLISKSVYIATYYNDEIDDIRAGMLSEIRTNLLMGLFFGIIGAIGLFIKIHNETNSKKIRVLNKIQ